MSKKQTTPQSGATQPNAVQLAAAVKAHHTQVNKSKPKVRPSATCKAQTVKQCLGIDVGKDGLQLCFREQLSTGELSIKVQKNVANSPAGFKIIEDIINKYHCPTAANGFGVLLEATGVYHENVTYHLHNAGYTMHVVLANKAKNYAKSLGYVSKTDKLDAKTLAQMGLERNMEVWQPPADNMLKIRHLTREREELLDERTAVQNQYHAQQNSYQPDGNSLKRYQRRIAFIDKQIAAIEQQLHGIVATDGVINTLVNRVDTIKGIGFISAVTIIAETNGFEHFRSRSQVASYAGYDVVENQSGKQVGKSRISKRGNVHLRRTMHFCALTSIKHDPTMKNLYERILQRSGIKMKACVAVQRKMLVLAYTLCKNETDFDPDYHNKNNPDNSKQTEQTTDTSAEKQAQNTMPTTQTTAKKSSKTPQITAPSPTKKTTKTQANTTQ